MTETEKALKIFRAQMAKLQAIRGWNDEELAKRLDCSKKTISNMRNDPFSVKGQWILPVLQMLRKAERELEE